MWKHTTPDLYYKLAWWANQLFNIGIYGLPRAPFEYQVLRGLLDQTFTFSNLEAPPWLAQLAYGIVCPALPRLGVMFATFDDLSDELLPNRDIHVWHFLQRIGAGHWNAVLTNRWKIDQQPGHFTWDDDNATVGGGCESDRSLSPVRGETSSFPLPRFRAGSMNDMFNDPVDDVLQLGEFNLLAQGVADRTRAQRLACWKRWGQYYNCLDISPWLPASSRGWGEPLIDFLFWEHKIFGLQRSTISKRFYAIRFLHVAEGYDDLDLRGKRAKSIIKAVKKRGEACKKVPFNTDLLRWIYTELPAKGNSLNDVGLAQLRAGLLCAFFCLGISALSALQPEDAKFTKDNGEWATSILIRESKTDKEKAGVARMHRATGAALCPGLDMRNFYLTSHMSRESE